MKLRIKGNSVRIRLSVTEVETLSSGTPLRESTAFAGGKLEYSVEPVDAACMNATFENNRITLLVPQNYLVNWPSNSVVGFDESVAISHAESLRLLLEKDFKCLDVSEEDQADYFENPSKVC